MASLQDKVVAQLVDARRPLSADEIVAAIGRHPGVKQDDLLDAVLLALQRAEGELRITRRLAIVGAEGEAGARRVFWTTRPTSAPEPPPAEPEAAPAPPPRRSIFDSLKRGRRPAPPAERAPAPSASDLLEELLASCEAADRAAMDLATAMARRHAALVALSARFPAGSSGKSVVNRQLTPSSAMRALAGAAGLHERIGLPAVARSHASDFSAQARSLPRPPPDAPAASGSLQLETT